MPADGSLVLAQEGARRAATNAAPITYRYHGRQYIVVAIASADVPAELVALALPRARNGGVDDR